MPRQERHQPGTDSASYRQDQFTSSNNSQRAKARNLIDNHLRLAGMQDDARAARQDNMSMFGTEPSSLAAYAYRGSPYVYDYLHSLREIHESEHGIQKMRTQGYLNIKGESKSHPFDVYAHKYNGTSLADVENMQTNARTGMLSPQDIQRINKMFRTTRLSNHLGDQNHSLVLESMTLLATQQFIVPKDQQRVSRELKRLEKNVTAYFDFYAAFVQDSGRNSENELGMLTAMGVSGAQLLNSIAIYTPARLGITPSSAEKLILLRAGLYVDIGLIWKSYHSAYKKTFRQAYTYDAFPPDLQVYQHYDEVIDQSAAQTLGQYADTLNIQEIWKAKRLAPKQIKSLQDHRREIIRDIMASRDRRLVCTLPQEFPGDNVTVIRNRDTLIAIVKMPDDTHVTLEFDKKGEVFGIPPALLKSYPYAAYVLVDAILSPLLKQYQKKNELIQRAENIGTDMNLSPTQVEDGLEIDSGDDEEVKVPKRRRIKPITIFQDDPLPPEIPEKPLSRSVLYSESMLRELLGEKNVQQKTIDRMMADLRMFEQGYNANAKQLTDTREPMVRIRSGEYRMQLRRGGNGEYELADVIRRTTSYVGHVNKLSKRIK